MNRPPRYLQGDTRIGKHVVIKVMLADAMNDDKIRCEGAVVGVLRHGINYSAWRDDLAKWYGRFKGCTAGRVDRLLIETKMGNKVVIPLNERVRAYYSTPEPTDHDMQRIEQLAGDAELLHHWSLPIIRAAVKKWGHNIGFEATVRRGRRLDSTETVLRITVMFSDRCYGMAYSEVVDDKKAPGQAKHDIGRCLAAKTVKAIEESKL